MAGLKGLADRAKQFLSKNPDKARHGIDRASRFADEKTGGKYGDRIDKGADKAKGYLTGQDEPQEGRQAGGDEKRQQGKPGQEGQEGRRGGGQPPQ